MYCTFLFTNIKTRPIKAVILAEEAVILTLTLPIVTLSKPMEKKKASTPSITSFFPHTTERDKHNSPACVINKVINCIDMEMVEASNSSGDGNMEKSKQQQQLEAASMNFSSNAEIPGNGRRNCCPTARAVASTPSSNTKDGELCIADVVIDDDGDLGRSNERCAFEITPGKKRVKVMVVENERESDRNVGTVDVKQDVETPKAVAVTDDEDCSEGGSAKEGKLLKYSKQQHGEMTDNNTCNERKGNRSTIEAPAGPAVGTPTVPQSKDDVYIDLRQTLGGGEMDNKVKITPRKISTIAATDSSSASTPVTTISAPEMDPSASSLTLHKSPSSSAGVMRSSSPVSSKRSGELPADLVHYELQLEEAVSLFEKIYKERPDKMLGFDEAIDYAIEEHGKKLKQKQDCADNGFVVVSGGVGSSSESSSSFSSFPDVLCPALSCIIQGDRSRLDNLTLMAFEAIADALKCSLSSDKNKSTAAAAAAAETLLHSVTERNVAEKIQLLAARRTYGNPPPKATVTSLEDKTPLACWIWEVQCIEALPGMCVSSCLVRHF